MQDLLFACTPTADDAEVAAYLRSRGLDPERIDHEAVAYALPMNVALPAWAGTKFATWTESDHRLLLPALDAGGRIVSIRARRIRKCKTCKTLSPSGFTQRGTLFADSIAHGAFAGVRAPMQWTIVEGDIDFLTWVSRRQWERDDTIAVVGIFSGSWQRSFATAVPQGARVVFRGHEDASGRGYIEAIQADLRDRALLLKGAS